jgi:hypothetical protein
MKPDFVESFFHQLISGQRAVARGSLPGSGVAEKGGRVVEDYKKWHIPSLIADGKST